MSLRTLLVDCGLTVVVAVLLIALTGLGVVALIAVTVVAICTVTFAVEALARRGRRRR
ncbi:MAG: hypothetical protein ACR2KV_01340 [Solirubrobacteraceae bacterium]